MAHTLCDGTLPDETARAPARGPGESRGPLAALGPGIYRPAEARPPSRSVVVVFVQLGADLAGGEPIGVDVRVDRAGP